MENKKNNKLKTKMKREFKLFDNRVRCIACGKSIKLDAFGGIVTINGKTVLVHNKSFCLLEYIKLKNKDH